MTGLISWKEFRVEHSGRLARAVERFLEYLESKGIYDELVKNFYDMKITYLPREILDRERERLNEIAIEFGFEPEVLYTRLWTGETYYPDIYCVDMEEVIENLKRIIRSTKSS